MDEPAIAAVITPPPAGSEGLALDIRDLTMAFGGLLAV